MEIKDAHRPIAGSRYELFSVPAFGSGSPERRDGGSVGSTKRRVMPGDVLLSKINPRINRVWLVPDPVDSLPQVASPEYLVLRLREADAGFGRWLTWYLRSPRFRAWIEVNVEGATGSHTRAKSPAILQQSIPVAPPPQRDRIIDFLELQMSRLDEVLLTLAAARRKLSSYSRSVLIAACDGRLVGSAISHDQWETVRYGDLVERITSGSRGWRRYLNRGQGRFVLTQNVKDGRVDLDGAVRIDAPTGGEAGRTRIQKNDILITVVGEVGRTARVRADAGEAYVSQSVALTRPSNAHDARYLEIYLRSPRHGQAQFQKHQYGVGRGHLLLSHLRDVHVRLPPIEERDQIADAVDAKLSVLEAVDREIQSAVDRAALLRVEILGHAFSGRLLDQGATEVLIH